VRKSGKKEGCLTLSGNDVVEEKKGDRTEGKAVSRKKKEEPATIFCCFERPKEEKNRKLARVVRNKGKGGTHSPFLPNLGRQRGKPFFPRKGRRTLKRKKKKSTGALLRLFFKPDKAETPIVRGISRRRIRRISAGGKRKGFLSLHPAVSEPA